MDAHLPQQAVQDGALVYKGTGRFYRPDPLDERFGATDPHESYASQAGMYGCLDIPREHTRTAFDADQTTQALERLKDEPFTLHLVSWLERGNSPHLDGVKARAIVR